MRGLLARLSFALRRHDRLAHSLTRRLLVPHKIGTAKAEKEEEEDDQGELEQPRSNDPTLMMKNFSLVAVRLQISSRKKVYRSKFIKTVEFLYQDCQSNFYYIQDIAVPNLYHNILVEPI